MLIVLDAGPLGALSHPLPQPIDGWLERQLRAGEQVVVPEIADYEVRRELRRAGKVEGLRLLGLMAHHLGYEPITTQAMRLAADLWAEARRWGRPTAPDLALDGDVILAAQARVLAARHPDVVVATTNPKHLERFVDARVWLDI